ncbi:solute carrier family 2, facilitated glucose transporter member 11-like [Mustelus asterias]
MVSERLLRLQNASENGLEQLCSLEACLQTRQQPEMYHLKVLLLLVIVSAMGGTLQHGLNMSIINTPSVYIKCFINETWLERHGTALEEHAVKAIWSVIVSVYSIGAVFGALIGGHFSVKYGRRNCLIFNNILTIVAAFFVGFSRMARSFEMILVARFLYGVNSGNGMNVHCMYIMECSPKKLRGIVTITTAIFISLGKCLGQIMGLREILGSESVWPLLMSFNALPAFIQLITLPWFPESPRYLLIDKGNRALSMNALQRLWGKRDFSQELEEMQAERAAISSEKARSVWELCRDPSVRSQLLINMMMSFLIQLSGINAHLVHWMPYCSMVIIFAYVFCYGVGPGELNHTDRTDLLGLRMDYGRSPFCNLHGHYYIETFKALSPACTMELGLI